MVLEKSQLRTRMSAARSAMSPDARHDAGRRLTQHLLAASEVSTAAVVAGYVGVGTEPDTLPLLSHLRQQGTPVLLPILRDDNDLDWAEFAGEAGLVRSGRGLLEPAGRSLGVDAVCTAEVVLCPGIAVARDGLRLGRGGGSYDRVLSRVSAAASRRADAAAGAAVPWTCVLLYDHEVLDAVPGDPHDRPVHAAATPSAVLRFR